MSECIYFIFICLSRRYVIRNEWFYGMWWMLPIYGWHRLDITEGPSWSWSYVSWIYNYLCNRYQSPLKLWVQIQLRRVVLDTAYCDTVCKWLATGRWFSPGTIVSSSNKISCHDTTDILLKEVALFTINQTIS